MKVAVVILNWNGESLLQQYLPSVIENNNNRAEIYVADNHSSDGSLDYVRSAFPEIKIIELDKNYGYAGGYNRALETIDAEIYVLLNSDVEVTAGWLDPALRRFEQNPQIAAIQPKILSYNDKQNFEYAGAAGGFIDKWGYTFCRGRLFDHIEKDIGQYDQASEIFWASGACLFIRAEVYSKVGGLDADFFAHMEEIDLCWRVKNSGYSIWYEPSSTIYHLGGGTLGQGKWQKTYLNFRNNLFLLVKNDYSKGFILKLFFRMVLDGISGVKFLFEGQPKHTYAILKAHFKLYVALGSMVKKRKALKRQVTHPNRIGIINKSVVWGYFAKKKKTFKEFIES